jgi:BASS family bile acid:Na+ symporter
MLLPLTVGLAVKARYEVVAARTGGLLNRLSTLSLGLLIVLLVVTNFRNIIDLFGTRGILASILFVLVGFGSGWFLGGPGLDTRGVLALGSAQRNIAAALLVGGQNFGDPRVVVMVVVVAIVGLLILMPLSRMVANRSSGLGV